MDRSLKRQHHPGKHSGQDHNKQRPDADTLHLQNDFTYLERPAKDIGHRPPGQQCDFLHDEQIADNRMFQIEDGGCHRDQSDSRDYKERIYTSIGLIIGKNKVLNNAGWCY